MLGRRLHDEARHWSCSSPLTVESLVLEMLAIVGRMPAPAPDRLPPRWLGAAIGPIAGRDINHARAIARLLHGFVPPHRIMAPLPTYRGAA